MTGMREAIRKTRTGQGLQANLPWARYLFEAGFPGFDGHFPGRPVLPGVCMLKAAVVTLEDWHATAIRVSEVRKARFLSPLGPGQELEVRCIAHKQTDDSLVAQLTMRGTEDRRTSGCTIHYSLERGERTPL